MFRNAALGPHHDATPKQFPSAAVGQHHDAAPGQHLGTVPGQHPGAAAEQYPGAASSQPRPAPDPPRSASGPQRPSTVSGSTPPVPHRAHNIPALSRGPSQEPSNKKSVRIATFLRLAIVASSPIANRGTKTQQKWHISSLKEPRRAPNRKKVAKIPSFLFFAMGPIAATGQITRKCAEHHDQQSKIRNKKGARHADASRKTNSAEIYASLAPYCS